MQLWLLAVVLGMPSGSCLYEHRISGPHAVPTGGRQSLGRHRGMAGPRFRNALLAVRHKRPTDDAATVEPVAALPPGKHWRRGLVTAGDRTCGRGAVDDAG